jgi:hypothetical protein
MLPRARTPVLWRHLSNLLYSCPEKADLAERSMFSKLEFFNISACRFFGVHVEKYGSFAEVECLHMT